MWAARYMYGVPREEEEDIVNDKVLGLRLGLSVASGHRCCSGIETRGHFHLPMGPRTPSVSGHGCAGHVLCLAGMVMIGRGFPRRVGMWQI